jgi:hypothetical protein
MLRTRAKILAWLAAVIITGLVWRKADLGLPFFAWKYGGSALWGAMVFLLVRLWRPQATLRFAIIASLLIATAVEFSRLYETPWLDEFRQTLAGQLLLGRVFSLWNLVAYAAGIGMAAALCAYRPKTTD